MPFTEFVKEIGLLDQYKIDGPGTWEISEELLEDDKIKFPFFHASNTIIPPVQFYTGMIIPGAFHILLKPRLARAYSMADEVSELEIAIKQDIEETFSHLQGGQMWEELIEATKPKEKDMCPSIHFDPTEATKFEQASPGTYPMKIDEVEEKTSKEKKEPMLLVWFRFLDPELDKKIGRVPRNFMLAGKGAGFTVELWKKATGQNIADGKTEIDSDDLVGKELTCEVTNEEYEGQMRNKIEKIIG